jgi:hypothetical protein
MTDDGTREDEDNRLRSEAMAQAVRPLGREVDRPVAEQPGAAAPDERGEGPEDGQD